MTETLTGPLRRSPARLFAGFKAAHIDLGQLDPRRMGLQHFFRFFERLLGIIPHLNGASGSQKQFRNAQSDSLRATRNNRTMILEIKFKIRQ